MILDLHLHTLLGSSDSSLTIEQAAEKLIERGLDGACLTEHSSIWEKNSDQIEDVFSQFNLKIFRGLEITTNYGHIISIGFEQYIPGSHDIELLRKFSTDHNAFLISAHPSRRLFGKEKFQQNLLYKGREYIPSIDEFSSNILFEYVDGVEVLNGGNNVEENNFAFEAAKLNGKIMTGGSDAHSESGVGIFATEFAFETNKISEIVNQLKSNQVQPVFRKDNKWIAVDEQYYKEHNI